MEKLHLSISYRVYSIWGKGRLLPRLLHTTYYILHTNREGFIRFTRRSIAVLLLSAVLFTGTGIYYLFYLPGQTEAAWFDDSWTYRQRVDVTNSGSAQTDFQVSFVLDTNTLYDAGKLQSDCDDIRVTDTNGKLLPYWIEQMTTACGDSNSAQTIWVKIPTVGTTGNTLYVYYGNPSATAYSSGAKTFDFFEDFSSSTLDSSKWTATGAYSISGGAMTTTTGAVYTNSTILSDSRSYMYEQRTKWTTGTTTYSGMMIANASSIQGSNAGSNKLIMHMTTNTTDSYAVLNFAADGTAASYNINAGSTSYTATIDTYHISSFSMDATQIKFYNDRSATNTYTGTWTAAPYLWVGCFQGSLCGTTNAKDLVTDWIIARKYASTAPSAATPTNEEKGTGPIAYWKFDEGTGTVANTSTSNNTSPNDYDATINGPTWQTEDLCVTGKCLYFDGTDDDVNLSDNDNLEIRTHDFTVSAWVNFDNLTTGRHTVIQKITGDPTDSASYGDGWIIHVHNNYILRFTVTDGPSNVRRKDYTIPNVSGWHYVVGQWTASGSVANLYVDGVSVGSAASSGTISDPDSGATLKVGEYSTWQYKGRIDEVKVYNYALTAAQIRANYVSKTGGEGGSVLGSSDVNKNLSSGLVGYWKMDEASWTSDCTTEEVLDASGNSNNGESCPSADANDPVAGKFGNGGSFDGTNDYVAVDDATSLDVSTGLTISSWINPTTSSSAYKVILEKTSAYELYSSRTGGANEINYAIGNTTPGWAFRNTGVTLTNAVWSHVVLTYDGATERVFVNGVQVYSQAGSGNISNSSDAINIGRSTAGSNSWLDGKLDEARVYNRALSPNEVSQLYNFAPGPVGYWDLNDTATPSLDRSGNANSGTWTGNATHGVGKYGKGISLDGTGDYVQVSDSSTLDVTYHTISAWVYFAAAPSASHFILERGTSGGSTVNFYLWYQNSSTRWLYGFRNSGDTAYEDHTYTHTPSANRWYHLTVTHDGTDSKLYMDGVLVDTEAETEVPITTGTQPIQIGTDRAGNNGFNGKIDDVKIYNYARTSKQVIEDMNGGHPNVGSPVGSAVGHWKFDEGSVNTCTSGGSTDACNSGSGGSTFHGSFNGNVAYTQSGKFGKAATFDGTQDYVAVTSGTQFNFSNTQDFSVSAWVYMTSVAADNPIIDFNPVGNGHALLEHDPSSGWMFRNRPTAGSQVDVLSEGSVNTSINQWYHITLTRTGSNYVIYRNGVSIATGTSSTAITANNSTYIGHEADSDLTYRSLLGNLDELKVYTYALTAAEVKLDMNQGSSQVLGALSDDATYQPNAAAQEYCVPGDTSTVCDGTDAPVGRWDFEEGTSTTTYDKSGNGFNGTLTSGPTWTTGKQGKGVSFDGSDDFVTIADNATLTPAAITVEVWVNPTNLPGTGETDGIIDKRDNASGTAGYLLQLYNNAGTQQVSWAAANGGLNTTYTVTTNAWTHLAVTQTGTSAILYVNGRQQNSGTTAALTNYATALLFGKRTSPAAGTGVLDGKIDAIRIFDYVRTPAQIAWDYNKGAPVGHWKLDECQGTAANDSSGNSNSGTITVGGTGTYTSAGTCASGTSTHAWAGGVAGAGKRNYALSFDGTDDYVTMGDVLDWGSESWAVGAWVKSTDTDAQIVSKGTTADYSWGLVNVASDSTLRFVVYQAGGSTHCSISIASHGGTTDGGWHQIVGVWTAATSCALYIDGVLRGSSTSLSGTFNSNSAAALEIARRADGDRELSGQVDDVRVYNYALTATQIKQLMNEGTTRFGPVTGAP